MDQTLQKPEQSMRTFARVLVERLPIQLCLCAAAMLMLASTGCQSANRLANLDLPVPPTTLDQSNIRLQSPDGSGTRNGFGNNVRSLNQRLGNRLLGEADEARSDYVEGVLEIESQPDPIDGNRADVVADVIIQGNQTIPTHHLTRNISTRPGRYFDPDKLQQDVDQLWRMPEVSRVNGPYLDRTSNGVVITIDIVERNLIREVEFIGNRGITDRALRKETGLEDGSPLDVHQIRMAKSKIEDHYKEKGYPRTQVEILEGDESEDAKVVFLIHEDQQQRIWKVEFEGNKIATDGRLKHFIESKPGILKVVGGLVKRDEIEQDILRLTNYYRNLGFFNARIGREISESNDGRWMTIRFIINEGPRYRVRNVSFIGLESYQPEQLLGLIEIKPGEDAPEFNVSKMNRDVVTLRDLYGSQGFVFANVEAEPRFLEEPGLLDIVYKIDEGEQYRVGNINIHYEGGYGITRREVVLNRLGMRPGDLIDVREIRNSERRLGASQIFAGPGTPGAAPPRIVVKPAELQDNYRHANSQTESNFR